MLHSNAIGLGFAITSAIGGVLAERFGFRVIFLVAAAMLFASVAAILPVGPKLYVTDGDGRSELAQQRTRPKP
jgi:predicted MFS family arabinose efflux permease